MLALRLLTGIPLAMAAVWFVLTQQSDSVLYALIIIAALAGWEWAGLAKAKTVSVRIMFGLVLAMTLWSASRLDLGLLVKIQIVTTVLWLVVVVYLSRVKSISHQKQMSSMKLVLGVIAIIPAMLAMWMVHDFVLIGVSSAEWLLFGMSLVWVADIGAYFAGRKFGKHKLAPVLSPGKTREGFYGAMILTLIYSLVASVFYFELSTKAIALTLLMTFVLTVLSVAGDLFESLLKRSAAVKDSGKILPGHGGVLDRVDSLTATMSWFSVSTIYIFNLDLFLV